MGFQHFVGSASAGRIQRGDPAFRSPVRAAGTAAEHPRSPAQKGAETNCCTGQFWAFCTKLAKDWKNDDLYWKMMKNHLYFWQSIW